MGSESGLVYMRTTNDNAETGYKDHCGDSTVGKLRKKASEARMAVAASRADKVDDLIGANPTSGGQHQHQNQQRQRHKIKTESRIESMIMRRPPSSQCGHYERPLHRHFHDNNNNNSNNNNNHNNGKVRLLIAPASASTSTSDYHGSKQQLVHSTTTIATTTNTAPPTKLAFNFHNKQPQQQKLQQHRSQQQVNRPKNYHHYDYYTDSDLTSSIQASQANHYEENILLFATEHNASNANQISNGNAEPPKQQQVTGHNSSHTSGGADLHFRPQSSLGQYAKAAPTGKFVNYYPSWRQSRSLAAGQQNYSFHVPSFRINKQQSQTLASNGALLRSGEPNKGFRRSYRSRTIAHIPDMVKVSQKSSNHIDFYEQPSQVVHQFNKSEADLLKVHVLDIESGMVNGGHDNPFKPGTELSWEADMMVRLMKRGYPVEELPMLVQTAKQVAIEKNLQTLAKTEEDSGEQDLKKWRQSSNDLLNSGKQVWANSLSRAKSMPRFSEPIELSQDADSIDKLISTIELESSILKKQTSEHCCKTVDGSIDKGAERLISGQVTTIRNKKGKNKKEKSGDEADRSAISGRRLSNRQTKVSSSDTKGNRQQADLSKQRKLDSKKKERNCCIIQ